VKFAAILPVALFLSIPGLRAQDISAPLRAHFAYVANLGGSDILGYTINPVTGALTAIAGSPFAAGKYPQSVAVDSGGKFAYAVNEADGSVSAYSIGPSGALTPISGSPFAAGEAPQSVVVDPSGKFACVVNAGSDTGNVSGYTINPATGALTAIAGSPFAAGVVPLSVAVDPSGKFAYVVNADSINVSGYTINPATGALMPIPGSPFTVGSNFSLAGVTVDPNGKFVYVTGQGVFGYTIDSVTGRSQPSLVCPSPSLRPVYPIPWRWTRAARHRYQLGTCLNFNFRQCFWARP
jgi:6-phosphogluconolactonase